MNPVPIELPLRPSEAAQLAALVYEHLENRPLNDDARNRLAGRCTSLGLQSVRPYFGSLEGDPVHAAAFFLAVDGLSAGDPEPLLLHIAPASAPVSPLFPNPLLIGRMRPGGGREIVINAVAFGPGDSHAIEVFARQVGSAFLPRAHGLLPSVRVVLSQPALAAPDVFRSFRSVCKSTGRNLASISVAPSRERYWQTVWAAIRVGYREGYTLGGALTEDSAQLFSYFTLPPAEILEATAKLRALRPGEPVDVEADLSSAVPAEIPMMLDELRASGTVFQSVLLPAGLDGLSALAAAVAAAGALPAIPLHLATPDAITAARNATNSRLILVLRIEPEDAHLLSDAVGSLA